MISMKYTRRSDLGILLNNTQGNTYKPGANSWFYHVIQTYSCIFRLKTHTILLEAP